MGHSLTVNGEQDDYGEYMPLDILKYINWDVYSGKEKIYHGKASVMGGVYEGTLEFNFPLLSDDNTVLFAVPDYVDPFSTKIDLDNDHDKYKAVIEQYLKDRNIENSPYVMDKAYAGDILNNGSKSAVITVSSTAEFREERWSESWSEEEYKENKAAIFSAVLLIPDCEKPHEYIVVDEAVRQDGGHAPMCGSFYIIDVADVLKQNGCELLLVNFGYESRNYAIFSLTDSNKMN